MADILTRKSTRQVTIQPKDGSGRSFVLFGLASERLDFQVGAPSRRTLSQTYITQQRTVSRRRYTLRITIFEPNIQANGSTGRLDRSSLYEETQNRQVRAADQLEMVHAIAKLHEQGILIAYSGISVSCSRAAIVDFNAEVVYATGTGSLTIEERDEQQLDIQNIAVTIEAIENALKELEENAPSSEPDHSEVIDAFLVNDTATYKDYLAVLHAFQAEILGQASFTPYVPTNDPNALSKFNLRTLPIKTTTDEGTLQIFPDDPDFRIPAVRIISLDVPSRSAAGFREVAAVPFNISVATSGLFIDFQFTPTSPSRKWQVTAWVFSDVPPLFDPRDEDAPIADPREDPEKNPPADPRDIAFRSTRKGIFKDTPRHIISANVEYGVETRLADLLTFSFVPVGGGRRDRPANTEIRDWALAIADYRSA